MNLSMLKKNKKNSLLLELLIALTLVVLCVLPLARAPLGLLKGEILAFQRMETIRMSEIALATTMAKLYKNEIPWELIARSEGPTLLFQENVSTIMDGACQQAFTQTCTLQTIKQREGKNGEDMRLVKITVSFEPTPQKNLWLTRKRAKKMSYFYEVFVSKIPDHILSL